MLIHTDNGACVLQAFAFLDIDIEPLVKYAEEFGLDNGVPWSVHEPLLEQAGFVRVPFQGNVCDFVMAHQEGNYFIVHETLLGPEHTHAFAMLDGSMYGFKLISVGQKIRTAWKSIR